MNRGRRYLLLSVAIGVNVGLVWWIVTRPSDRAVAWAAGIQAAATVILVLVTWVYVVNTRQALDIQRLEPITSNAMALRGAVDVATIRVNESRITVLNAAEALKGGIAEITTAEKIEHHDDPLMAAIRELRRLRGVVTNDLGQTTKAAVRLTTLAGHWAAKGLAAAIRGDLAEKGAATTAWDSTRTLFYSEIRERAINPIGAPQLEKHEWAEWEELCEGDIHQKAVEALHNLDTEIEEFLSTSHRASRSFF